MDPRSRSKLVAFLHKQMVASAEKMFAASATWNELNQRINRVYGTDTADARIKKRESLEMKDAMAAYTFHRDHANTCANMLTALAMWPLTGDSRVSVETLEELQQYASANRG